MDKEGQGSLVVGVNCYWDEGLYLDVWDDKANWQGGVGTEESEWEKRTIQGPTQ